MNDADYIVVGSGCSGAMAAQTLAENGAKVLMLDVGEKDEKYTGSIPPKDFESIRREEEAQHNYFLGEGFESLDMHASRSGAQLTPPRKHIVRNVAELLHYRSQSFVPVESLAYGGLGAGWGLGCCVYSEHELNKCTLDAGAMQQAYDVVAERIGISADAGDNASPYTIGKVKHHLPPLLLDETKYLLNNFYKRKNRINYEGFFLGRPALALLSQDYKGRKATAYDDMHFYRDAGNSAYRPGLTVDELKKKNNFHYEKNQFVLSFSEKENGAIAHAFDLQRKEKREFAARKIVLAAGALGTARIVLRSLERHNKISFLCNPYTYYPCLNFRMAGKKIAQHKTGMAQLSLFHDPYRNNSDVAMASLYSYRSLFLFRLLEEVPLNFRDAKEIMRFLLSGIVIMGIHHPDSFSGNRFMQRVRDDSALTGDSFKIEYTLSDGQRKELKRREKKFVKVMAMLGARAMKRVEPAMGASIHYAGTLPFSKEEKELSLAPDGRLHGTKNIYAADSSGFTYLPAKGLTFSLMANAHNVALRLTTR